jgi:hypothetical protein
MAIVVTMGLRAARTLTKGDLTRSEEAGSNTVAIVAEPGQEAQVGQRPQRVSGVQLSVWRPICMRPLLKSAFRWPCGK